MCARLCPVFVSCCVRACSCGKKLFDARKRTKGSEVGGGGQVDEKRTRYENGDRVWYH